MHKSALTLRLWEISVLGGDIRAPMPAVASHRTEKREMLIYSTRVQTQPFAPLEDSCEEIKERTAIQV